MQLPFLMLQDGIYLHGGHVHAIYICCMHAVLMHRLGLVERVGAAH